MASPLKNIRNETFYKRLLTYSKEQLAEYIAILGRAGFLFQIKWDLLDLMRERDDSMALDRAFNAYTVVLAKMQSKGWLQRKDGDVIFLPPFRRKDLKAYRPYLKKMITLSRRIESLKAKVSTKREGNK